MAHFKTGWLQKEQVLDIIVAEELKVGDMAYIGDGNNGTTAGSLYKTEVLANADYIIAQSDMTMEYGHVPVEKRDWDYSDKVAISTEKKKVAVFFILDESDIILD